MKTVAIAIASLLLPLLVSNIVITYTHNSSGGCISRKISTQSQIFNQTDSILSQSLSVYPTLTTGKITIACPYETDLSIAAKWYNFLFIPGPFK